MILGGFSVNDNERGLREHKYLRKPIGIMPRTAKYDGIIYT